MNSIRIAMISTLILLLHSNTEGEEAIDCGPLVAQLAKNCAWGGLEKPSRVCCETIREWNDGYCWCDVNANEAAKLLSRNEYGFQFRATSCNIDTIFRPSIRLPNTAGTILNGTCPASPISKPEHPSQVSTILKLLSIDLEKAPRLLTKIISEKVEWFDIGLGYGSGITELREIIHFRQVTKTWYNQFDSVVATDSFSYRKKDGISYRVVMTKGEYRWIQLHFVQFSRGPQGHAVIDRLTIMDGEVGRLFEQFVKISADMRAYWGVKRASAVHTCDEIRRKCGNFEQSEQFGSLEVCVNFFNNLRQNKRVACLKYGLEYTSLQAIQGDSISCRWFYLILAGEGDAKMKSTWCGMVGREGLHTCADDRCDGGGYDDAVFRVDGVHAVFEEDNAIHCSVNTCWEG